MRGCTREKPTLNCTHSNVSRLGDYGCSQAQCDSRQHANASLTAVVPTGADLHHNKARRGPLTPYLAFLLTTNTVTGETFRAGEPVMLDCQCTFRAIRAVEHRFASSFPAKTTNNILWHKKVSRKCSPILVVRFCSLHSVSNETCLVRLK